jgi:hypothetical protein
MGDAEGPHSALNPDTLTPPPESPKPLPETPTQSTGETESRRDPSVPMRGAVRIEVKTSLTEVHAGSEFTVFAKITNPFDTPLLIKSVVFSPPVEFREVSRPIKEFKSSDVPEHTISEAVIGNRTARVWYKLSTRENADPPSGRLKNRQL